MVKTSLLFDSIIHYNLFEVEGRFPSNASKSNSGTNYFIQGFVKVFKQSFLTAHMLSVGQNNEAFMEF
jgi:hypothetical protein